ncbi:MAG TPA: class I SAM-dependent methyltransferase [Thermoanaerobaculia bacterium]|jgi:SAM-dependent methyltransferase
MAESTSLPFWDPRKILEIPRVYNFYQKAVGAERARRHFIQAKITPFAGKRVLEVGCGPGTNCGYWPANVEYVGCDVSERYITWAKKRYGDRGEFYAAGVGELRSLGLKPFDGILALNLLHHLSDDEVLRLCDEAITLLKADGVFITGDPCFNAGESRLAHFVTARDRGQFVRYPQQYEALLRQRFSEVAVDVGQNKLLIVMQSGIVMTARGGTQ